MKRTLLLSVVATTLLAAGCARQQPESPPVAAPDRIGSCSVADTKPTMQSAKPIHASVDLDHDGVGDAVKVTLPGSACPHLMFTRLGDGRVISLDLGTVDLSLGTGRRVVVPKRDGDLLAVQQVHPRGGFQEHLYGWDGTAFAEVTAAGQPVIPFVATDSKGGYVSVSCAGGALVVQEAVAHTPPGIVFAWDVRETSYPLHGNKATAGAARKTADNVLDERLGSMFPQLTKREMFRGCAPG
jgi:hypothetical protein